jgi:hypothetical protein
MIFTTLVAFSALFVAGCAAFFSIKGLIVLFSGSALAIGIMASSLEIGKLVAASFLHTHWSRINFLLKTYLCLAVLTLMGITSLGIFGFLTGAYQVHSTKVGTFSTQIASLTNEKAAIDAEILEYTNRVKVLTEVRTAQEQRLAAAGNYKIPRELAYKAIAEANEEIQKKETEISKDRQKGIAIDKELASLNITMNTTTDIGSFKFIADALNTSVDTAVQYFIFLLIFVFDPLAVTLVIAWNNLLTYRKALKAQEDEAFLVQLNRTTTIEPPTTGSTAKIVNLPAALKTDTLTHTAPQETQQEIQQVNQTHLSDVQHANNAIHPVETAVESSVAETATSVGAVEEAASPKASSKVVLIQPSIVFDTDFENDPRFLSLSEEQKNIERARRRVLEGANDSVITT